MTSRQVEKQTGIQADKQENRYVAGKKVENIQVNR